MRAGLERQEAIAVAVAAAVWLAAIAGLWWGWHGVAASAGLGMVSTMRFRRPAVVMAAALAVIGAMSGHLAAQRQQTVLAFEVAAGPFGETVRLRTDAHREQHGWWALAVSPDGHRPPSVPMLLSFDEPPAGVAGELLSVQGMMTARSGTARGDAYAGVVRVGEASLVASPEAPWWRAGNAVRRRTLSLLSGHGPSRGLLAGFLIGETADVPEADLEAMRRSGISHLVAVSGSNVALFLMLAVVAAGPLASGPRRRAVVGLGAVVVLVVATRWEPSVMRASVMAALVLLGRIGGWALDAPTALATTVVLVVCFSGELATDVGFALSVLATVGVVVGGRSLAWDGPRPVVAALGATGGAQIAVAPLLLVAFGSIPLMAPLTNLVAAPVVAAATTVGVIGVATGWEPLIALASAGASTVLFIARIGAGWPQLGWRGLAVVVAIAMAMLVRRLRPLAVLAAAAAVAMALVGVVAPLPRPGAVVMDVGQGDSILVVAGDGSTMLVDGGPDPAVLEARLGEYGVTDVDLLVLTHVHADHATGLAAVIGRRQVGEMWVPGPPHETPASQRTLEAAALAGIPMREPPVGEVIWLGDLRIDVLGPRRRYASPNDQSAVLLVTGPHGRTLLLTGDIETYAQADLAGTRADVLKVPHQGGATSDLDWLAAVGASEAVISVGPNDFGHPSLEVVEALRRSGARVHRTDREGSVVIPLSGPR